MYCVIEWYSKKNYVVCHMSYSKSFAAGFREKTFDWINHSFLRWNLLFFVFTSIQLSNKWPVAQFKKRGSPSECLHRLLLFFSILFCYRNNSKHHFPLPSCLELTQVIVDELFGRLEWKRLGLVGWFPLWIWERPSVYGRSSCWICSSWCCPGELNKIVLSA